MCLLQIPSDNVPFNELPDMKAAEITAAGKEALLSKRFDMVRINYANPDMVGAEVPSNYSGVNCPPSSVSYARSVCSAICASHGEQLPPSWSKDG